MILGSEQFKKPGAYQSLIVYQQAIVISDLNNKFCQEFLDKTKGRRIIEQRHKQQEAANKTLLRVLLKKV